MKKSQTGADLFAAGGMEVELVPGLPKEELERRVLLTWRAGEVSSRALAFYLADMELRRVHLELGYPSTVEFATQRLSMSKGRARDLLLVGRKLGELPALDQTFSSGDLSWSKVRRLARVATPETEQAWVDRAKDLSHEEVDALVGVAREGDWPVRDGGLPRIRMVKRVVLSSHQNEIWELVRERVAAELGRIFVTDEQVVDAMLRRFFDPESGAAGAASGGSDGDRGNGGGVARGNGGRRGGGGNGAKRATGGGDEEPPSRLRDRVLQRDGWRCQHCGSRRDVMTHHVLWRSREGVDRAENMVTLCSRCHGLVHDELLFVSGRPGNWCFADRRGWETKGPGGTRAQLRTVRTVTREPADLDGEPEGKSERRKRGPGAAKPIPPKRERPKDATPPAPPPAPGTGKRATRKPRRKRG